ncbi:hypothetical protein [Pontiella sulfatireligans]|uniref:Uncharacterized protein n=1 Tax=Pontiella sulfatireligans TaxID=2750658 RepID=A0A6C2UES1_9BACT|nr:hypothetical protein [Pontiella sulfatireligans]VGO18712.1 hypothetical protein SCARR_00765 [Pontiella sulfatireligans]
MKKTLTILFALAIATVASAGSYFWFSDADLGSSDPGYDLNTEAGKGAVGGRMVAIFKATEARPSGTWYKDLVIYDDFSVSAPFAGDMKVYQSTLIDDSGWVYFDETVSLDDGSNYYTVIFDVPTGSVVAGSEYIIIEKVTFLATGTDYEVYSENQNAGIQWNTVLAVPSDNPPEVIITTPDAKVLPAVPTYDISGTANANVVGNLVWSNAWNGAFGTIPAAASWTITSVPLDEGVNTIAVSGTNSTGTASKKIVEIIRQEISTAPWFQGFETNTPSSWSQEDTWAILQGADLGGIDPGAEATPESQTVRSHLASWQSANEPTADTALLELDEISVSNLTGALTLTAHLSAISLDEEFIGLLNGDQIKFYVALDGAGYSATPDITIEGFGSADGVTWGYNATGVASTTAGSPMSFQPTSEGELADGFSTVQITIPAGTSMVKMKVEAGINIDYFTSWNLDDISLTEAEIPLEITDIAISGGDVHLEWQGGAGATQVVEYITSLEDTGETWKVLYTAPLNTTNFSYAMPTNNALFYRLRTE